MSAEINLKAMTEAGLHYVTRLSNSTLASLLEQRQETADEVLQMELGDAPKLIELDHEGQRYVLAGGACRAQRDRDRRAARLAKGEQVLRDLAAKKRKKVNGQKLASTIGRALEKVKAHKYFSYEIDASGQIRWERKSGVIEEEQERDGWYLLHTNLSPAECNKEKTLSHYKGLLEVEDAFRELKTYLEVRPIRHYRPDRVINHIRLCFLAYWISARLGREWVGVGEHREVVLLLRSLQTIRIGRLSFGGKEHRTLMTAIPEPLEATIKTLKLGKLFSSPPTWMEGRM
jgi:transposase